MNEEIERYSPDLSGQISYEHRHRYGFAFDLVEGKEVLDVACGEGYGASALAKYAASVLGLDVNERVISAAKARYQAKNLSFSVGDCRETGLPSNSFDVIVSFETIEHIAEQDKFLIEMRRLLKKNGIFIVSTPNKPVYNEFQSAHNTFHQKELDKIEFNKLLKKFFKNIRFFGQRMFIGSMISDSIKFRSSNIFEYKAFKRPIQSGKDIVLVPGTVNLKDPIYFLAVCANVELSHGASGSSIFMDECDDLWLEHLRKFKWASNLHNEDEKLRAWVRATQSEMDTLRGQLGTERSRADSLDVSLASTQAQLDRHIREAELNTALASRLIQVATLRDDELAKLQSKLGDASAQLSSNLRSESQLSQLKLERDLVSLRLAELEKRLADRDREIDRYVKTLLSEREFSENKQARIDNKSKEFESMQDRMNSEYQAVVQERDKLVQKLEIVSRERTESQLTSSNLLEQLTKREQEFDDLRAQLMAEQARERESLIRTLESSRAELNRALDEAAKLQSLRQELSTSQLQISNLQQQIVKRQDEFDYSRSQLISEHAGEYDRLAEALATARADLDTAKCELTVQNQRLSVKIDENIRLLGALKASEETARIRQIALNQDLQLANDEIRRVEIANADFRRLASTWVHVASMERFLFRELAWAAQRVRSSISGSNLRVLEGGRIKLAHGGLLARRAISRHEAELVRSSGLFDADWYRDVYPDLSGHKDPLRHFIEYGLFEFRDPHPLFSAAWYWEQLPLGMAREQPPFLHYLSVGRSALAAPHPLFDPGFYLDSNPDVKSAALDPLLHFLASGEAEGRDPHPLVKLGRLQGELGTASSSGLLRCFIEQRKGHLKSSTTLFDAVRYIKKHVGLENAINPLLHYLVEGWREGLDPIPLFAGDWYLAKNDDLLDPVQIPLVHYARYGAAEGRSPHPLFEPTLANPGRKPDSQGRTILEVYLEDGWRRRLRTSRWFTAHELLELVPKRTVDQEPLSCLLDAVMGTERQLPEWASEGPPTARMGAWPPILQPTYWIAQDLRDHLSQAHDHEAIALVSFLLGVIERFPCGLDPASELGSLCLGWMRSKAQQQRAEWKDGIPDVTVIVPVHNQMIFTFACLCSILSLADKVKFEIIVGDDCSTDGTFGLFRSIGGCVRLIRHEPNLGFLNNCNACAKSAMGEYFVFLNNDAIVLPHWLDSLIDVFEHQDCVGLVGSKLLNVDGSLQEAGGIFWSDGSAWNFGRNQNPRKPEFNYVKDVDYCSGASIALRASKWRELGGFDPIFSPAYCEDSDLAFRVRAAGLRVVFTPFSEVIHHEGVSHGRDINIGVKAYQVRNTELFRQRWSEVLSSEHFPNGESVFLARDRSRDKKHVLVIDHYIPQFDRDAGSRTMFQYMRMFTYAGYQVVLWPDNLNEDREYVTAYQNLGVEVIYGPDFVDGFSRWMAANGNAIDYVFATRPHVTEKYIDPIRAHSQAKIIYYGQDLHYARLVREQAIGLSGVGDPEIRAMKNLELNICRKSDFVLYPSEDECRVVGSEVQSPSKVIEFPIFFFSDETLDETELRIAAAEPLTKAMMFVGGFSHKPNADGVLWFASEVWPLVREHDPEFLFRIAGSNPPSEIMQLDGSGIEVLGRISDEKLTELYQTSFCTIAPLRYGAGVKGKVIEAFAAGTPVVTTTTGVQGIDGNVAFVTDDPKEMARLIIQASQDPAARAEKAKAALEFVRRCYSINAAAESLGRAMPELPGLVRASKVVHKPPQHVQALAKTLGAESGEIDGRR